MGAAIVPPAPADGAEKLDGPARDPILIPFSSRFLLDRTPDVVLDRPAGALAKLVADLAADRLEAGLRGDLRDPGAHRAQADDSHPTNHAPDATEEVPPLARLGVK